jgi:hypothetical protein
MTPVRCSCYVDVISEDQRLVTVTGQPPHAHVRIYTIDAKDDKIAAFEGLYRFESEMNPS